MSKKNNNVYEENDAFEILDSLDNQDEDFDEDEDEDYEETDYLYKPLGMNTRKSIVSSYIVFILQRETDKKHPMTIKEIVDRLNYTFEIEMERRAVSRCIHTLADAGIGVQYKKKVGKNPGGAWYDENKIWPEYNIQILKMSA